MRSTSTSKHRLHPRHRLTNFTRFFFPFDTFLKLISLSIYSSKVSGFAQLTTVMTNPSSEAYLLYMVVGFRRSLCHKWEAERINQEHWLVAPVGVAVARVVSLEHKPQLLGLRVWFPTWCVCDYFQFSSSPIKIFFTLSSPFPSLSLAFLQDDATSVQSWAYEWNILSNAKKSSHHGHQPLFSPVLFSVYYSPWRTCTLRHNHSSAGPYYFIHP